MCTVNKEVGMAFKSRLTSRRQPRRQSIGAMLIGMGLLLAACGGSGSPDPAASSGDPSDGADNPEPVTLTLLTAQVEDAVEHEGLWMFVERLEENAPWITINYAGGPEVVPPTDQVEAVTNGAFDMVSVTPGYYTQSLPSAYALLTRTKEPLEEREDGSLEIVQELHQDINVHYLGTTACCHGFQFMFGDKGSELDPENLSFSGMTLRSPPTYQPTAEALGASIVTMPFSDVYTAIERGVIDGTGVGAAGVYALGIIDVVKYELRPDFLQNTYGLLVNQEKWETLDQATQDALTDTMIEIEGETPDHYREVVMAEEAQREADGVTPIELSDAEAEEFRQTAIDATWEAAIEGDPRTETLRELWDN